MLLVGFLTEVNDILKPMQKGNKRLLTLADKLTSFLTPSAPIRFSARSTRLAAKAGSDRLRGDELRLGLCSYGTKRSVSPQADPNVRPREHLTPKDDEGRNGH